MADRIVVLRDGVVEQEGAPLSLYDRPANLFVATFIGSPSMNLLAARAEGGALSLAEGLSLPAPPGTPDGPVTVGLRPDALRLAETGAGALPARLRGLEAMGNETILFAERDGPDLTIVTKDRPRLEPGQQIHLAPDPAHLHVFGADGRRIG